MCGHFMPHDVPRLYSLDLGAFLMTIRIAALIGLSVAIAVQSGAQAFRPPSVPLVTFDPYLSIWSAADHLTDKQTQHWTKHRHALVGLVRVDGQTYRIMGPEPAATPAMPQVGLR